MEAKSGSQIENFDTNTWIGAYLRMYCLTIYRHVASGAVLYGLRGAPSGGPGSNPAFDNPPRVLLLLTGR
jgi:hypothetical protein